MASVIALRVAARFMQSYGPPKETKQRRVEKLTDTIRSATGLGRGTAESIADAIIRGRDWLALRIQKNWPIDDSGLLEGPKGTLDLHALPTA
jgi:hypothetical protein